MTQLLRTSGNSHVAVIQLGKAVIKPRVFGFYCANTCCTKDGVGLTSTCCVLDNNPHTFCIHHFVI